MAKKPKTDEKPIDEELINLLQTVSKNKPKNPATSVEPVEPPADPAEPEPTEPEIDPDIPPDEPDDLAELEEEDDEVIPAPEIPKPPIVEPELRSIQEVRAEKQLPPSQLLAPDKPTDQFGGILLEKFGASLDIILRNHKADREQVENAIKFFEQRVRTGESKGMTPFVEAWVKALATKAEINSTATSALDSVSKLLAAGKGNELVVNVTGIPKDGELDLEALLSQPKQDDEQPK